MASFLSKINKYDAITVIFTVLSFFSFGVNFSPTSTFKLFAPILWVPLGFLLLIIMIRNPNLEKFRSFSLWRKALCFLIVGSFSCYLAHFLVVFGVANFATIMTGTPFQDSSFIVKKSRTRKICSHIIDVDKYSPGSGGVCLDGLWLGNLPDEYKELWETSKKGDEVILFGKQTSLGSSITKIVSPKQESSAK